MSAYFSLMALLCPRIKQITNIPIGIYKPPIITFLILLCFVFTAKAQEIEVHSTPVAKAETLSGIVVSTEINKPLEGASLKIKNTKITTLTNASGEFFIVPELKEGILEVSFMGYKTINVSFKNSTTYLIISLEEEYGMLEEVEINTGYQNVPRERATGSFSVVNNRQLEERVATDVVSKLNGITSALVFDKQGITGQPELRIRGRSTIYANEKPLIVIDNFPYEGDIDNINPNDVESVVVLKDAAAASIWGVRAGNGVIVINTKNGEVGKDINAQINSNISFGKRPDLFYNPNFLRSSDFIEMEKYLFEKGFYTADLISKRKVPLTPLVELLYAEQSGAVSHADASNLSALYGSYDIRKDQFDYLYRNSVKQQYSFSLNGGRKAFNYYFSSGYDKNISSNIGTDYSRFTINSKNRFKITDNLDLNIDLNYAQSLNDQNRGGVNLNTGDGKGIYPYARLVDESKSPISIVKDYRSSFVEGAEQNGFLNWGYIPLNDLGLHNIKARQFDTRVNTGITYNLKGGLTTEIKYMYQNILSQTDDLAQEESYYVRDLINKYATVESSGNVLKLDNVPIGDILDVNHVRDFVHNIRGQLNFNRSFNEHGVDGIVGVELKTVQRNATGNRIYGYDDETGSFQIVEQPTKSFILYPLGISSVIPNPTQITGGIDRFRSYFANIAYSYRNYTLSTSGRIDQSNFFGVKANQRSVPLWSSGLKWNISNENFYGLQWLPKLSLRATFGYNGNLDRALTGVTTVSYYSNPDQLTGLRYADVNSIGNAELRWEKTAMLNLGLDFLLKGGVIRGSIEYFNKRGSDMIGDAPMAPSSGVSQFRGNYADMEGKGIDLEINSVNINKKFKWHSSLLFSYAVDKIRKYDIKFNPVFYFGANGNTFDKYPIKGYPLYSVFSLPWGGLDPQTGNPLGFHSDTLSQDYSKLNAPSLTDILYHGSAKPVYTGSVYNRFSVGNFSLSFNIGYKLGYYFRRTSIDYNALYTRWSGHVDFSDRWRTPGDENFTSVPSMVYPNNNDRDIFYSRTSTLVERGDHIGLQYLTLNYDLLKGSNSKLRIVNMRFYVHMENLGILWRANKHGIHPEYQAYGGGAGVSIPAPMIITTGFKLTL